MQKCGIIFLLGYLSIAIGASDVQRSPLARYRRHNKQTGCTLPPFPEHGKWKVLLGQQKEPGEKILKNNGIKYDCNLGYRLSQISSYLICDNKWGSVKFPECEVLCPPLSSTPTTKLRCTDKRGFEINCNEATEGTYLTFNCTDFYETPFGYKKTLFCSEGSWNFPKPVCEPVCGKIIDNDAKPLIYGGTPNKKLKYPWVTAVYKKINDTYQNICGGSILSLSIIVTAAHCVTNDFGDVLPKENFVIGVGKIHNKYKALEDNYAQYLELSKIIVHDNYRGDRKRFLGDIAILVTQETIVLNEVVQPICFIDVNNKPLHVGSRGVVSGWGKTEDGLPSEVLRTLEMPYKYETTCAQELPPDWADKYYMGDKICAGYHNRNISVCSGDSGSGLAFKDTDDNRYYLHGLVSLGPTTKDNECDIQQNALYTRIATYYEFVDRALSKYAIEVEDCRLPSYPQNGKWAIDKQQRKPGDAVSSNTVLRISCNLGYKLSSLKASIECGKAHLMPTCQVLCPPVAFPKGTNFQCISKTGKSINCLEAVDGATLTYSCPKGYQFPEGTTGIRSCIEGSWGLPQPTCVQEDAGKRPTTVSPDSVSSVTTQTVSLPPLTPSSTGGEENQSVMVICVYAATRYHETNVDPDDLDSSLCTHVIYSYVELNADGSLKVQGSPIPLGGTKSLFHKVADMKKRNPKLKIMLTVKGSGDKNAEYPTMAADAEKRNTFIRSAISFMEIYKFDGLDIQWNVPDVDHRNLYISLLKEVKEAFEPKGILLTASVYISPTYIGYETEKMYKILDWINVLNYDNYDATSRYTGQYSAFKSSSLEDGWEQDILNLVVAGKNWQDRGFKKDKIVLSIAFYGRYFTLQDPKKHGIHAPTVPGESDVLTYSEICQKYSNNKWRRVWDDQQKNPYKYSGNKWFGYEDPESVKIKANYISQEGYLGIYVYSIEADDVQGKCGPKQSLLKYINAEL